MSKRDGSLQEPLEISIRLRGGLADSGEVTLEDYRTSLEGWQSLIELGSRVYFLGERANPDARGTSPFSLHVRAPERGSVTTEILLKLQDPQLWGVVLITGVATNALWDLIKHATPEFVKWLALLCRDHVDTKRRTPNIDALVQNLQRMVDSPTLPGNQLIQLSDSSPDIDTKLFERFDAESDQVEGDPTNVPVDRRSAWLRQIVESIDSSLEEASRPIGSSCTSVDLLEHRDGAVVTAVAFDASDREVVLKPLSFGDESADWERARVKFRRIDRESGSVMFRFEDRPEAKGNQFGYIADKTYLRPHNPYTQALDAVVPLSVWVHPEITESGGVRYAIRTARPPAQLSFA